MKTQNPYNQAAHDAAVANIRAASAARTKNNQDSVEFAPEDEDDYNAYYQDAWKESFDKKYGYGAFAGGGTEGTGGALGTNSAPTKTTTTFLPKCRHKATPVFQLGPIIYCGGSQSLVENLIFPNNHLIVCLLGDKTNAFATSNPAFQELSSFQELNKNVISIDWRDYGAPPVGFGFWSKLHDIAEAQGMTHIIFYCIGGHGRTGTALAAVLVENVKYTGGDAIKYVRKAYCKEAVESLSQDNYLDDLYNQATAQSLTTNPPTDKKGEQSK